MKMIKLVSAAAALAVVLVAVNAFAQAEGVKSRAKDLKKKVEGGQTQTPATNAPAKPAPKK